MKVLAYDNQPMFLINIIESKKSFLFQDINNNNSLEDTIISREPRTSVISTGKSKF